MDVAGWAEGRREGHADNDVLLALCLSAEGRSLGSTPVSTTVHLLRSSDPFASSPNMILQVLGKQEEDLGQTIAPAAVA